MKAGQINDPDRTYEKITRKPLQKVKLYKEIATEELHLLNLYLQVSSRGQW